MQWAIGGVLAVVAYYYNESIVSPESRIKLAEALRRGSAGDRYRVFLTRALDFVDRRLSPDAGDVSPTHWRRAWTPQLFEFSLSLALLYPAFALVAFWALTPADGRLGADNIFLENVEDASVGAAALASFVVALLLTGQARRRRRRGDVWGELVWLLIAVTVITAGVFAVVLVNDLETTGNAFFSTAVIVSISSAATVAVAGALPGATAMAITALIALSASYFLSAMAGERGVVLADAIAAIGPGWLGAAGAGALALAGLAALPVRGEGALSAWRRWFRGVVARAFAFFLGSSLGACIGILVLERAPDPLVLLSVGAILGATVLLGQLVADAVRYVGRALGISFLAFLLYTVALFYVFTVMMRLGEIDNNIRVYFLLFAFLPLLNALFDYFSTGATRWALRKGLDDDAKGLPIVWSGYDVVAAVALFTGLGLACVVTFHYARAAGGAPLLDVPALFADLRANPENYGWIYFTLTSTLAPTMIHFSIASFSLVGMGRGAVAGWLAERVERGESDGAARATVVLALTVLSVVSLIAPVALLGALVWAAATYASEIGSAYLSIFEAVARALGAA
ncbi:MAG: hypothetical protein AAFR16_05590 [Pseudomonadota bacterium]